MAKHNDKIVKGGENVVFLFLSPKKQRSVQIVKESYITYSAENRVEAAWPNQKDITKCYKEIKLNPDKPPEDWPSYRGKVLKNNLSWVEALNTCKKAKRQLEEKTEQIKPCGSRETRELLFELDTTDTEQLGRSKRKRSSKLYYSPSSAKKRKPTTSPTKPGTSSPSPAKVDSARTTPAVTPSPPKKTSRVSTASSSVEKVQRKILLSSPQKSPKNSRESLKITPNKAFHDKATCGEKVIQCELVESDRALLLGCRKDNRIIIRKLDLLLSAGDVDGPAQKADLSGSNIFPEGLDLPLEDKQQFYNFASQLKNEEFYKKSVSYLSKVNKDMGVRGSGNKEKLDCILKTNLLPLIFSKHCIARFHDLDKDETIQGSSIFIKMLHDVTKSAKLDSGTCDVKTYVGRYVSRNCYRWRNDGFGDGRPLRAKASAEAKGKEAQRKHPRSPRKKGLGPDDVGRKSLQHSSTLEGSQMTNYLSPQRHSRSGSGNNTLSSASETGDLMVSDNNSSKLPEPPGGNMSPIRKSTFAKSLSPMKSRIIADVAESPVVRKKASRRISSDEESDDEILVKLSDLT